MPLCGNNAGHTLVVDGVTYKLSLLPSGIVRKKLSVIGNGVVVDPWALRDEIGRIADLGTQVTPDVLKISDQATLILPLHRELDQMSEAAAGKGKIGREHHPPLSAVAQQRMRRGENHARRSCQSDLHRA